MGIVDPGMRLEKGWRETIADSTPFFGASDRDILFWESGFHLWKFVLVMSFKDERLEYYVSRDCSALQRQQR